MQHPTPLLEFELMDYFVCREWTVYYGEKEIWELGVDNVMQILW